MYKVFIENREVNFLQAITLPDGISLKNDEVRTFKKWLLPKILARKEGSIINVICEDLEKEMEIFFKSHTPISAAGGIVEMNEKCLFIRRFGLWDLPKGKLEKNESPEEAAVREVEEECGISGVWIKEPLLETYHTYELKGKRMLKRTYWYSMGYEGSEEAKPQTEEGITEVKWVGDEDIAIVLKHTYPSIIEVVKLFMEKTNR
jgi:8-oxo-dGTP pyrophosphatase MutT (NUDIX family)